MTDANLYALTPEQAGAFAGLGAAISARLPSYDVRWLAGTGKTEVLKHAARQYPRAPVATFTNRAAAMLSGKIGRRATTIHSLVKTFNGIGEDGAPTFRPNGYHGDLVFVDEASTVNMDLADTLRTKVRTVITFGDHGQLPPVDGPPGFAIDGDAVLTKVHRQALGSAVIRQAHAVRETGMFEADGADFQVRCDGRRLDQDLAAADIILCFTKATREAANVAKRRQRGYSGAVLRAGEPIMCLESWRKLDLWRGQIWRVVHDCQLGSKAPLILADGTRTVTVYRASVEGIFAWPKGPKFSMPFRLAYAATVHQAQGSEWPRALLVNERPADRRWLYTGITRASKGVVIMAP